MKPGDKVVYNGKGKANGMRYPEPFKEVLTISGTHNRPVTGELFYIIEGYECDVDGIRQFFHGSHLIPIEYWKQAEYMVEELKEELEVTV